MTWPMELKDKVQGTLVPQSHDAVNMEEQCDPPPPLGPAETVTNQITLGRLPRKGAISLGLVG